MNVRTKFRLRCLNLSILQAILTLIYRHSGNHMLHSFVSCYKPRVLVEVPKAQSLGSPQRTLMYVFAIIIRRTWSWETNLESVTFTAREKKPYAHGNHYSRLKVPSLYNASVYKCITPVVVKKQPRIVQIVLAGCSINNFCFNSTSSSTW